MAKTPPAPSVKSAKVEKPWLAHIPAIIGEKDAAQPKVTDAGPLWLRPPWWRTRELGGQSLCLFSLNAVLWELEACFQILHWSVLSEMNLFRTPEPPSQPTSPVRKLHCLPLWTHVAPWPLGLGRSSGVSLLYLLCALEVDGAADKNRKCQRSQPTFPHRKCYELLCMQWCCKQFPVRVGRRPCNEHNCISQLLNIDSSQQGLGLLSKEGCALTCANLIQTQVLYPQLWLLTLDLWLTE